jgi:hypothetical protein
VLDVAKREARILAHAADLVLTRFEGRFLLLSGAPQLRAEVMRELPNALEQRRVGEPFSVEIPSMRWKKRLRWKWYAASRHDSYCPRLGQRLPFYAGDASRVANPKAACRRGQRDQNRWGSDVGDPTAAAY